MSLSSKIREVIKRKISYITHNSGDVHMVIQSAGVHVCQITMFANIMIGFVSIDTYSNMASIAAFSDYLVNMLTEPQKASMYNVTITLPVDAALSMFEGI